MNFIYIYIYIYTSAYIVRKNCTFFQPFVLSKFLSISNQILNRADCFSVANRRKKFPLYLEEYLEIFALLKNSCPLFHDFLRNT